MFLGFLCFFLDQYNLGVGGGVLFKRKFEIVLAFKAFVSLVGGSERGLAKMW